MIVPIVVMIGLKIPLVVADAQIIKARLNAVASTIVAAMIAVALITVAATIAVALMIAQIHAAIKLHAVIKRHAKISLIVGQLLRVITQHLRQRQALNNRLNQHAACASFGV